MRLDVFCREPRHRGARPVIQPQAMHADQQAGVVVRLNDALNSPLIKFDMFFCGKRHEAVRQTRFGVDMRLQFPLAPAIVVSFW